MAKDKSTETETAEINPDVVVTEKVEPEVVMVVEPEKPKGYVLKKSHGIVLNGRTSRHFMAGTSFDEKIDAEIIALLARTGAQFE